MADGERFSKTSNMKHANLKREVYIAPPGKLQIPFATLSNGNGMMECHTLMPGRSIPGDFVPSRTEKPSQ